MSRLFLSLFLLCCSLLAAGQSRIKGQIKNFYPAYLEIYPSQFRADVDATPYRLSIDDDGRFDATLSTFDSGFASFYHYGEGRLIRFWLSPDSEDQIVFDQQAPVGSFVFSGTHAAVNQLLNSAAIQRTEYYQDEPWVKALLKTANTKSKLLAEVGRRQRKEQQHWDALKEDGRLSAVLYTTLTKETEYFWQYLLIAILADKGITHFLGIESLKVENIHDPEAIKTRYYFHYLQQYFEQLYPEADHVARSKVFREKLQKPVLEPFLAHYLQQHAVLGDRHSSLVSALVNFEAQYPESLYLDRLKMKINPLEDVYALAAKPITEDMEIYEGAAAFGSIEEVIEKYKGEVLYFDIWATWCGPCIQEFKLRYRQPLNEFIDGKPVRIIYVSVDRDQAHDKWVAAVKRNKLNSVNVRFAGDQRTALLRYIGVGPNDRFGIPRYFIVNKEGKLVNANAPRPSLKEFLFPELAKYL